MELKPCPFCGQKVEFAVDITGTPYGVTCVRCHTVTRFYREKSHRGETFGDLMERIAMSWNRREGTETMPSEWMVMTNFVGGECFYQVFRLKDKNAVDHAGNREIIGGFDTEQAAKEFAEALNEGRTCVSRS